MGDSKLTYGQKLVRAKFNPSGESRVDGIKSRAADLIDFIQAGLEPAERSNAAREANIAITLIQQASMMAVAAQFPIED